MRIITDSPEFFRKIHPDMTVRWRPLDTGQTRASAAHADKALSAAHADEALSAAHADSGQVGKAGSDTRSVFQGLFKDKQCHEAEVASSHNWNTYCLTEASESSQYDLLVKLAQENTPLPDGLLCLAGEGLGFHGFRKRAWAAPPGNIYVSCYWAPNCKVVHAGVAWMVLAAVSVVDAIDLLPGLNGRASIKWVNDILIDGAKVCGVLAHSLTEGDVTTGAILGIGLNVTATPDVDSTPYVPKAACLSDFAGEDCILTQATAMSALSQALDANYRRLLSGGCSLATGSGRR